MSKVDEYDELFGEYRMDDDTDIEELHNRLNPAGSLGMAYAATGGMNTGYFYSAEELNDPATIAQLLGSDEETSSHALRLLEGVEDYTQIDDELDLLPMELSIEDMTTNTLSVLKSIGNIVKTAADTMLSEMSALEVAARYLEFRANNLRITSKDRRGVESNNTTFVVNTRIANLSVKYYPVSDLASLITAFNIMSNTVTPYLNYLTTAYNAIDKLNVGPGRADALTSTIMQISPMQFVRMGKLRQTTGGYKSPHLLGCYRIFVNTIESSGEVATRYSIRLNPSEAAPRPLPETITFRKFPIQATHRLLTYIEDMAKRLQKANTPSVRHNRNAKLKRLSLLTEKLSNDIEAGRISQGEYRIMAAHINQLKDWLIYPNRDIYGLTCRNLRAILNVCELNLA